jgi:hypothetical protein
VDDLALILIEISRIEREAIQRHLARARELQKGEAFVEPSVEPRRP